MTIEFNKPGRIFARAYMLPLALGGQICGDLWGMLLRDPGKSWTLVFRSRAYESDDPHDGCDTKQWMQVVFDDCSDDEAVEKCDAFWKDFASASAPLTAPFPFRAVGDKLTITDLRGLTKDDLVKVMLGQVYAHPTPTSTGGDA